MASNRDYWYGDDRDEGVRHGERLPMWPAGSELHKARPRRIGYQEETSPKLSTGCTTTVSLLTFFRADRPWWMQGHHQQDAPSPASQALRPSKPTIKLIRQAEASPMGETIEFSKTPNNTGVPRNRSKNPDCTTAMMANEEKRPARKCTVDSCTNVTIDKGLCFRHGGGKTCIVRDCRSSAKIAGLCWKHGGSERCRINGCDRRGKSRGVCAAHGGGTKCQTEACEKVAVSSGLCWAHGGGKRCLYDGCQRPAYKRTLDYCPTHFKRFENGDEVLEV